MKEKIKETYKGCQKFEEDKKKPENLLYEMVDDIPSDKLPDDIKNDGNNLYIKDNIEEILDSSEYCKNNFQKAESIETNGVKLLKAYFNNDKTLYFSGRPSTSGELRADNLKKVLESNIKFDNLSGLIEKHADSKANKAQNINDRTTSIAKDIRDGLKEIAKEQNISLKESNLRAVANEIINENKNYLEDTVGLNTEDLLKEVMAQHKM